MARTAGMLALFTLFSRLLGLVRDMGMAWLVGCGPVADALVAALRLPHLLRRLLGEGSLSMTLTAWLVRHDVAHGREELLPALASGLLRRLVLALGGLVLLGMLAAPQLLAFLAPALSPEALAEGSRLLRLCLPYVLLAGLAAGSTVAAGVYAFLVVIGVYPRLIGKTATASKGKIFLYETIIALGGLFGNVVDLFTEKVKQLTGSFLRIAWPAAMPEAELWQKAAEGGGRTGAGAGFLVMLGNVSGQLLLAAAGLSCGIFVGCLVMSLAETLKALPVLSRRLRLAVGLPYLLLAIAAGKCAGSLYYFLHGIGRQ